MTIYLYFINICLIFVSLLNLILQIMFNLTKDTLLLFKSFKFKNLKHFDTHDGIAYTCELYYGNQKIADVENRGDGGMTDIDYSNSGEDLLNSLNIPQYYTDEELGFEIDNEYIISDLVEVAIWIKDALRNQSKSIIFAKGDEIREIKLKVPINRYAEAGKMSLLTDKVKELEDKGFVVLNTNID